MLAVLIGLMIGSARVLWPWPADQGLGNPRVGPPEGDAVYPALALGMAALALVWIFGLVSSGLERRRDHHFANGPNLAET